MKLFGNRHARYEALVTEYLDGALDATGEAKLNEHLAKCAACAAEVREQQAMLGVLRAQPMAEVPSSFALPYAPPVIAAAENRVSKLLRSMQIATATAAVVLVALVGVNVAQGPSAADSPSQQMLTAEMDSADAAMKSATESPSIAGTAPEEGAEPPVTGLLPDNQPDDALARTTAAAAPEEPSSGRNAIEWALIVMSGFTGVLAFAVVAATWLPRRPI